MKLSKEHYQIQYLVILFMLWMRFWNLIPFGYLHSNILYILLIIWIIIGIFRFKESFTSSIAYKMIPICVLFVGLGISMVCAYAFHGQSIGKSIFTYRYCYLYIGILPIYLMKPSPNVLLKSLLIYSLLYAIVVLLSSFCPEVITLSESELYQLDNGIERNLEDFTVPGYVLCAITYLFLLQRVLTSCRLIDVCLLIAVFILFLLIENRTCLFTLSIISLFSILKVRSTNRLYLILLMFTILLIFIYLSKDIWINLVGETADQLGDSDYNRILAYAFVFTARRTSFFSYFFGEGNISLGVSDFYLDLMKEGIFMSDIGLVGSYYMYGLIPVGVLLFFIIRCLISTRQPYYMKAFAFFLIIGSLTIFELTIDYTSLIVVLFMYLFNYYQSEEGFHRKIYLRLQ